MDKHELAHVEAQIHSLRTSHSALAESDDYDELLKIIHRPGWTTPAELQFVHAALESLISQTRQLTALRQNVLAAARAVGVARAANV